MAIATFELGNVQIDKLTEPAGGPTSSFGDTITAPGIDAPASAVFNLGATNATAINIGHGGLSTYVYGSSLFVGGNIDMITAGALNIGTTSITSAQIGQISSTGTIVLNASYAILYGPIQTGEIAVGDTNIYVQGATNFNVLTPNNIFSGSITPGSANTYSFGSLSATWKDGYFDGTLLVGDGTTSNPSYSFGSTTNAGMFHYPARGAGTISWSSGGSEQMALSSANLICPPRLTTINGADLLLDNAVKIGGELYPNTDNSFSLGDSSHRWKDGYFAGKIVLDGYNLNLSAGATNGQALVYNGSEFVAQTVSGGSPTVDEKANASDVQVTTTSATDIVSFTPGSQGNFQVTAYYRVVTATTNVTLVATWTDSTGAQTQTWVATATSTIVGTYILTPIYINATASAIKVTATTGTANNLYVSASIIGIS